MHKVFHPLTQDLLEIAFGCDVPWILGAEGGQAGMYVIYLYAEPALYNRCTAACYQAPRSISIKPLFCSVRHKSGLRTLQLPVVMLANRSVPRVMILHKIFYPRVRIEEFGVETSAHPDSILVAVDS